MTETPKRDWRKIKYYPVSIKKLKQASMREAAYFIAPMNIGEDYEYFDEVKHLLDIPEEPKTLEQIEEELNGKFEDLLVKTKRKFLLSKESAEYHYNRNFDTIMGNFEFAKTQGYFPKHILLSSGTFYYSKIPIIRRSNINSDHVINFGYIVGNLESGYQGYYTIGGDGVYYRFCMKKKPNVIFRWFVRKLMGFGWVDNDTL